jgi:lysozyme family protein
MGQDGSLNLNNIAGEIDWGAAIELIKFEGFYMFGGRTKTGEATNQLLIF